MTNNKKSLLIPLLTLGVFGMLNTEMGVTGILPHIARHYDISLTQAGLLVSAFALIVAISGPTMPLLFSKVNRKIVMLLATGTFALGSLISVFAPNFPILLISRVVPAIFHPVYVSMAMTVAAQSVPEKDSQQAIARVFVGVSAGSLLGVPVSNFLANHFSLMVAQAFFAIINVIVFIGSLIFVPSMPVHKSLSYGQQLRILKRKTVWVSIISVLFLNGAIFGFNSYLSDFLDSFSHLPVNLISILLLGIGVANIIGNNIAGRALAAHPNRLLLSLPWGMIVVYIALFFLGSQALPVMILILIFGVLAGIGQNTNQYMIYSVGDDAPDFANGLFLASANLGVTIGTSFAGSFINIGGGTEYSLWGTVVMLAGAGLVMMYRQRLLNSK